MKKIMCNFSIIVLIVVLVPSPIAISKEKRSSGALFENLKSLVGNWKKEGINSPDFEVTFELTANNSTLVETWHFKGKKHSLTIYHLDGPNIVATHYCPQGNQPRLITDSTSTTDRIVFKYLDATNLNSLDESHQHSLGFDLSKMPDKITRMESYLSHAGEKASELNLVKQ